jgi:hypothetical protein
VKLEEKRQRECEFGNQINDRTKKKRGEGVTKNVFLLSFSAPSHLQEHKQIKYIIRETASVPRSERGN